MSKITVLSTAATFGPTFSVTAGCFGQTEELTLASQVPQLKFSQTAETAGFQINAPALSGKTKPRVSWQTLMVCLFKLYLTIQIQN